MKLVVLVGLVVNFVTPKFLIAKSTMFPRRNTHKYTLTSPDGKTQLLDWSCTDL
jgi:hypothetical protein